MKSMILLVILAAVKCSEAEFGPEYAHFSRMPMMPSNQFHMLVDGFLTNWHLQQGGNIQEKKGVLDSLGQTVQTAINQSGTIGRILGSTVGALNVVGNLKNQISNPSNLVSNIGGSLLNQGISKLFGRGLQDIDGVFSGITSKVQEAQSNQQTIDSTLRTVDKGVGMIRAASDMFFGGQSSTGSLKNFFGFSLAQLEKQNQAQLSARSSHLKGGKKDNNKRASVDFSHLKGGKKDGKKKACEMLKSALRYLKAVEGEVNMVEFENHLFGPRVGNPGLFDMIRMSLIENSQGDLRVDPRAFSHLEQDQPTVVTDLSDYHPVWLPSGGINIAVRP